MEVNVDHPKNTYTLVLVGSYGVGKTTILTRLAGGEVKLGEGEVRSASDQCQRKYHFVRNRIAVKDEVTVNIMDTAGMEKYSSLSKSYFQKIEAVAFVYAVDNEESLDQIRVRWLQAANTLAAGTTMRFLIANKTELNEIEVYAETVNELVANPSNKFDGHYEVSGRENSGVEHAFEDMALKIHKRFKNLDDDDVIPDQPKQEGKGGCCKS